MNHVFIGLGSNRGDRENNLNQAIKQLGEKAGKVVKVSSVYETQPWQMNDDTQFLNQAIEMETGLSADVLMKTILGIEESMGRVRGKSAGYEPRTIDIDILFFNSDIIESDLVTVPHPQLHKRRFVLEPLVELSPDYVHPQLKKALKQLLAETIDIHHIRKFVSK